MKQGQRIAQHKWDRYPRIIVFDGVCNFCNAFVNFVIDRDPQHRFHFDMLQSPPAQDILQQFQLSTDDYETFLLIEEGRLFTKSTAALKILRHLGMPWSLFGMCLMIPRQIRDPFYDFVAQHRYQWMGKSDSCRVPTEEDKKRFV
ncbi:MAG: thiol-disulfide oxidoreductase DCC family protein [Nitrospirota bacterium]|nr:thiol-disulfide oxidoreductase DCC family protein [Nitrospirota bacterium]MDH5585349.1 thiol-disulfide oxidoreductase DCC family protein [Nitrospirota bacterium]MDH5773661.1 thiol-disulfide oxidoreductase DCC family protein [Nitrospirota bacterium]